MNRIASISLRKFLIALCIFILPLLYIGCGGSNQAISEDEMVTDTGTNQGDSTTVQGNENRASDVGSI